MSDKSLQDQVQKKLQQNAFQFSYDPLYKRFVRELRDQDNKDFVLDKNFLELKHLKEKAKTENIEDPAVLKLSGLSYIEFLKKKQRQQDKL